MILLQYPFALTALALCLVLSGIYAYFGYHVVRRGVIFVDLSLAQMAALGASVGALAGIGPDNFPVQNYLMSLGFTLLGALLFVLFRGRRQRVPIEALIGITYAGAIALSLLVLEKSASGTEDIKEMLTGAVFTVSPGQLAFVTALAAGAALVHWLARRPLLQVTEDPEGARTAGRKLWWWDLLFYSTFGLVVTSSVRVAGVLLVFAFLIIPAVAATLAVNGIRRRILFGWLFGAAGCVGGLELAVRLDYSAGPSVVATLLVLLTGTWAAKALVRAQ